MCLGSADFFAIDAYISQYIEAPPAGVTACQNNMSDPAWPSCNSVVLYDSNAGWAVGPSADPASNWLQATPQMLRGYLRQLQERWPTHKMVRVRHVYVLGMELIIHWYSTFQSLV
jgi:hypothetical protein